MSQTDPRFADRVVPVDVNRYIVIRHDPSPDKWAVRILGVFSDPVDADENASARTLEAKANGRNETYLVRFSEYGSQQGDFWSKKQDSYAIDRYPANRIDCWLEDYIDELKRKHKGAKQALMSSEERVASLVEQLETANSIIEQFEQRNARP